MSRVVRMLRWIPRPIRVGVKRLIRPIFHRLLEAYMPEFHEGDPGASIMSRTVAAKQLPMRSGEIDFIVLKPDPKNDKEYRVWSDGFPAPPKHLWHGYCDTLERFMEIGANNAEIIRTILRNGGGDIHRGDRVLDFGCAAGPVIRCLKEFLPDSELWGVDISGDHIMWCQQNLSPPFRFAQTSTLAHLPFEDHYFDLAYCGSVFSHMSDTADAWLLELARVIRPGGRLYLTMVTKQSMRDYLEKWPQLGFSKHCRDTFTEKEREQDFDLLVLSRAPWQHAVFDLEFFKHKCEAMFNVISITPNAYTYQWGILLERKDKSRRTEPPMVETVSRERMARV